MGREQYIRIGRKYLQQIFRCTIHELVLFFYVLQHSVYLHTVVER